MNKLQAYTNEINEKTISLQNKTDALNLLALQWDKWKINKSIFWVKGNVQEILELVEHIETHLIK